MKYASYRLETIAWSFAEAVMYPIPPKSAYSRSSLKAVSEQAREGSKLLQAKMHTNVLNDQVSQLKEAASETEIKSERSSQSASNSLLQEMKELQRENESLSAKLSNIEAGSLTDQVKVIDGVNVLSAKVELAIATDCAT